MVMPGASEQTSQVKVLNANWTAGPDGEDGRFEVMIAANIIGTWLAPTGVARVTATTPDQ